MYDNFKYLCLYKGGEYTFHIPVISSEVKINTKIKFEQAVNLLKGIIPILCAYKIMVADYFIKRRNLIAIFLFNGIYTNLDDIYIILI